MLGTMPASRIVAAALGWIAAAGLTACSTSTNGHGAAPHEISSLVPAPQPSTSGSHTAAPSSTRTFTATSTAPAHPVPAQPLRTVTAQAPGGRTYVIKVWAQTTTQDCAAHAYGAPVINYLDAHPCAGLTRSLATTIVNGRAVGISQCTIGFLGAAPQVYSTAGSFRSLVQADGTGSLDDLLREGYRLPAGPADVPQPDAFDALDQDAGVSVFDAWYLSGATPNNDPALVSMEHDLFLQY